MGMTPIHARLARPLVMTFSIEITTLSTISVNRIIGASNNATTRCAGLEGSHRQHAFAEHLMRFISSFGFVPPSGNLFPWPEPRNLFRERLNPFKALIVSAYYRNRLWQD